MTRIPKTPPTIPKIVEEIARPLWSVMIPAYNCSSFLPKALKSILDQDLGETLMQIEVVDDCSSDTDLSVLVQAIGKGRIAYFKQPKNVGSLRNFETCILRSRGSYVHLLHGDDSVKPGFYGKMTSLFESFSNTGAAISNYEYIDELDVVTGQGLKLQEEDGILVKALDQVSLGTATQYVSTVVKREVYEALGTFYAVEYGEDRIMWARIAKHYTIAYTKEVLARYRQHAGSISGEYLANNKAIKQITRVAEIVSNLFPLENRDEIKYKIKGNFIHWLLTTLKKDWQENRTRPNTTALIALVKSNYNPSMVKAILTFCTTVWWYKTKQTFKKDKNPR